MHLHLVCTLKNLPSVFSILCSCQSSYLSRMFVSLAIRRIRDKRAGTYGAFERHEVNSILMSEKKPRGIIMRGDWAELPPFFS